jgi:integrase
MKDLLSLKWKDIIGDKVITDSKGHMIKIKEKYIKEYIKDSYKALQIKDVNEFVFFHHKKGRRLNTSTLNRELRGILAEYYQTDEGQNFKKFTEYNVELTTSSFEHAWALNVLDKYNYLKEAFVYVSEWMGHKSVKYTCERLGVRPKPIVIS